MRRTFIRFNYKHGTKKGVASFVANNTPTKENLRIKSEHFKKYPLIFVALKNKKIVGYCRGTENRLINLFVEGDHHRQGIGTALLKKHEDGAKKLGSKKMKMRASIYGIPFYEKHGYKKSTNRRVFHGLFIQPMKKKI
jgi:GNAT superfamily N-acetyltransferase